MKLNVWALFGQLWARNDKTVQQLPWITAPPTFSVLTLSNIAQPIKSELPWQNLLVKHHTEPKLSNLHKYAYTQYHTVLKCDKSASLQWSSDKKHDYTVQNAFFEIRRNLLCAQHCMLSSYAFVNV